VRNGKLILCGPGHRLLAVISPHSFLPCGAYFSLSTRFITAGGYAAGRVASCELRHCQALLCATDMLALGAIDGLRSLGSDHPAPAVIGFDDIPQASWDPYQLTTIQQDTDGLAQQAVDLLVTRIAQFDLPSRHRAVPVKLIVRNSA